MSSFVKASGGITPNSADPDEKFPFLHTITVVDRVVSVDKPELVQNNIKTETVTLNLDSEWEGLSTVINIGNEKPVSVIWSGEPVVIPAELMTTVGSLDVSVVGYGDDGGIRAVTKKARRIFNVVASGFVEGDDAVPDPTTLLGQLIQAADNANQAADRFNQASDDIEGISPAIEKVQASEKNAKQSETNAATSAESASQSAEAAQASAQAAKESETNAAASATNASEASTAAKASETNAASSATAASQSASQAQSSATAAASSAQAASTSAESSKTASDSATSSKDAAAQSATEASASASAAKASETSAASSASAAKISETNAAASATAAQNAVGGFGLEVGTTTTGDPGTDAAVEIEKTGTKYTANFTIPRGDIGPAGVNENVPLGSTSGVVAQATDAYPALPRKVQVHGRTIENLCPVFNEASNHGVSFSTDSDGYITIKGTSSANIYAQYPIINFPANTKVWLYVDSDFRAKGINNVYAQSSGWSVYASTNKEVRSSTTPSATSGSLVINITSGVTVDTKIRVMFVASETEPDTSLFVPSGVNTVEPEKLVAYGKSEQENKSEVNLPSGISLADGDTLAIDRDGTTRILHAEGEPTVLENVTLPELPAPTFNVYTTGGYIQPTVDVDYERDVNLALDHEIPHDATLVGNGTKSSPLGVGDLSSRYTPTTTTTALDTRVKALEAKPSGLASVTHDQTLTGDGTSGNPLRMIDGNFINAISKSGDEADANNLPANRIYKINRNWKNIPNPPTIVNGILADASDGAARIQCILAYTDGTGVSIFVRQGWASVANSKWDRLVKESNLSSYVPLSTYQALETRVKALEAKLSNQ